MYKSHNSHTELEFEARLTDLSLGSSLCLAASHSTSAHQPDCKRTCFNPSGTMTSAKLGKPRTWSFEELVGETGDSLRVSCKVKAAGGFRNPRRG